MSPPSELQEIPVAIREQSGVLCFHHYKPEKKLQEPCVEMAKRIIRPLWAAGPFRPSHKIRKANVGGVLRFPFQPPA